LNLGAEGTRGYLQNSEVWTNLSSLRDTGSRTGATRGAFYKKLRSAFFPSLEESRWPTNDSQTAASSSLWQDYLTMRITRGCKPSRASGLFGSLSLSVSYTETDDRENDPVYDKEASEDTDSAMLRNPPRAPSHAAFAVAVQKCGPIWKVGGIGCSQLSMQVLVAIQFLSDVLGVVETGIAENPIPVLKKV
jgi:hypothetical protein